MEISGEEVRNLAQLARIDLTEEEVASFSKDLSSIVGHFAKISEAVNAGVAPSCNPITLPPHYREDEPGQTLTVAEALSGAPAQESGMFKVPTILGEE